MDTVLSLVGVVVSFAAIVANLWPVIVGRQTLVQLLRIRISGRKPPPAPQTKSLLRAIFNILALVVPLLILVVSSAFLGSIILRPKEPIVMVTPTPPPCGGCPLSPTPTPTPRFSGNLIASSQNVVAIYESGQSSSSVTVNPTHSTLQFTFNNTKNGTGLSLQFAPPLDVTHYHFVEINGTSTQQFSFEIQYKAKDAAGKLQIVRNSGPQIFPVSTQTLLERVPIIVFPGSVDEVVINIPSTGQSSQVSISSIQLVEQ